MPAIKARASGREELASRFVSVAELPWQKTRHPGVETKALLADPETGLLTVLTKMAPGARLPDHEHVLIEQTYVLEGTLRCGEGECKAGDFVWRPAGSRHEAWAGPKGCRALAMF
jgi:anti-sigma factor ChrR (cupin superfamily)